jgi:hypothetical protein
MDDSDALRVPGAGSRSEIVWLPKSYTDPNSRTENFGETTFSRVLTSGDISNVCPDVEATNDTKRRSRRLPKNHGFQLPLRSSSP